MRNYQVIFLLIILVGCGKDDPQPPAAALLVFPEQNSECTTGESINASTSLVEFRWQASENTDTYEVRATNMDTNTSETTNVTGTSVKLTLVKGALYAWTVTSKNGGVQETSVSERWLFYNSGAQTTYAPFPAEVLTPNSGATVRKDSSDEITLEWSGSDIDGDIASYEVYFGTSSPPEDLVTEQSDDNAVTVAVISNTVYYWKVLTFDAEGNSSDSGIYTFKVD